MNTMQREITLQLQR